VPVGHAGTGAAAGTDLAGEERRPMVEQITVIGNIVNSPQRRQTAAGATVVNFRIASTTRRFNDALRAWEDAHTSYYDVVAYRRLAEHALASLLKGQRVIISGTLKVSEWESGDKRGRSVDIEAAAIGHDLLWGTSIFTKTRHEAQTSDSDAGDGVGTDALRPRDDNDDDSSATPELVGVGADGWATPGSTADAEPGTPF